VLRLVRRVFESKWIETPRSIERERRGGAYIIDIDSSSSSFIFSRLQYNIVRMETFPPSRLDSLPSISFTPFPTHSIWRYSSTNLIENHSSYSEKRS
jgi:hypothetical protein